MTALAVPVFSECEMDVLIFIIQRMNTFKFYEVSVMCDPLRCARLAIPELTVFYP